MIGLRIYGVYGFEMGQGIDASSLTLADELALPKYSDWLHVTRRPFEYLIIVVMIHVATPSWSVVTEKVTPHKMQQQVAPSFGTKILSISKGFSIIFPCLDQHFN